MLPLRAQVPVRARQARTGQGVGQLGQQGPEVQRVLEERLLLVRIAVPVRACGSQVGGFGSAAGAGGGLPRADAEGFQADEAAELIDIYSHIFSIRSNSYQILPDLNMTSILPLAYGNMVSYLDS